MKMENEKIPRLKLISKHEYGVLKDKYAFFNQEVKTKLNPIIEAAAPSDVLALTVVEGSGLKIMNVRILNENTEDVFIELLKEGVGENTF
jgi:hypothetical protein